MSQPTIPHKIQLSALATAIGAMSVVASPVPALALPPLPLAPACSQYQFTGEYPIRGANGWNVSFTSTGQAASGPAVVAFDDGGRVNGSVNGAIDGRIVHFDITWNDNPDNRWVFYGNVADDGMVRNGTEYLREVGNQQSAWYSIRPLSCMDAPAPPPPQQQPPPPEQAPPQQAPPAKPTATVVGEDVDVYDTPGGVGNVIGVLTVGTKVDLVGACNPQDWCQVAGAAVPTGNGYVWGHLQF